MSYSSIGTKIASKIEDCFKKVKKLENVTKFNMADKKLISNAYAKEKSHEYNTTSIVFNIKSRFLTFEKLYYPSDSTSNILI